jgi:SnoaL-like domain
VSTNGLERLADELAIRDLANRYVHCIWNDDLDGIVDLFSPDGEIQHRHSGHLSRTAVGRDAVREWLTGTIKLRQAKPITENLLITFTSDVTATGSSFVQDLDWENDYRGTTLVGRYEQEFVKLDGTWKLRVHQAVLYRARRSLVELLPLEAE